MSIIRRSSVFEPFSSNLWDPFHTFDRFFRNALSVPASSFYNDTAALANTHIGLKETPEAHVVKADLPGVKKEEVKVEVEEGWVLQISGERSKEQEDRNDKWHRVERNSGKFLRRFRLPENAKVDQVRAAMENGVLTVTVPKEEVKKPEVKSIDISGERAQDFLEDVRLCATVVRSESLHGLALSGIKSIACVTCGYRKI